MFLWDLYQKYYGFNLKHLKNKAQTEENKINHLLSDLSELTKQLRYGQKDNHLPIETLVKAFFKRELELTCTKMSHLLCIFLRKKGYRCQAVCLLALNEATPYERGHTLVEIYCINKWILFDPSYKKVFISDSKSIGARELLKRQVDKIPLTDIQVKASIGEYAWCGQDLSDLYLARTNNKMIYLKWLKNMSDQLLIYKKGFWFFESGPNSQLIESLNSTYKPIDPAKFNMEFYQ